MSGNTWKGQLIREIQTSPKSWENTRQSSSKTKGEYDTLRILEPTSCLTLPTRSILPFRPFLHIHICLPPFVLTFTPSTIILACFQWRINELQYHKLHPNYILSRLTGKEENKYACRVSSDPSVQNIYLFCFMKENLIDSADIVQRRRTAPHAAGAELVVLPNGLDDCVMLLGEFVLHFKCSQLFSALSECRSSV